MEKKVKENQEKQVPEISTEKRGRVRPIPTRAIKNVIVGIDFSEGSLNAMRSAMIIAEKFNAKLTLLFVVSPDARVLIGSDQLAKTGIYPLVEMKLKSLVADCKKELPNNIVNYKIRTGKASKEINAEAEEQQEALIVVGTHGCSGFKEFFIGSSAFRTISGSSYPVSVLSVRYGKKIERYLTNILIVIDDTRETLQKLSPAVEIADKFLSKVHIVGLYPAQFPYMERLVRAYAHRAETYFVHHNIRKEKVFVANEGKKVDTILKYAEENDINLIIIMKEVELAGDNVFTLTSFSERIVNRSPVPILTVTVDESIYPGSGEPKESK